MNILDSLPKDEFGRLCSDVIKRGEVYLICLDRNMVSFRLTETKQETSFLSFWVTMQIIVYGGVVMNSRVNRNLRQSIKDYHYKISRERYTFMRYDSFIDCSSLIIAKQHKLIAAKCVGTLHSDDLDNVIGAVRESPDTSPMDLKRFGLN